MLRRSNKALGELGMTMTALIDLDRVDRPAAKVEVLLRAGDGNMTILSEPKSGDLNYFRHKAVNEQHCQPFSALGSERSTRRRRFLGR
jgi:hypothetical protein